MIKRLVPYSRDVRWQTILCPLMMILEVMGDILIPMMMVSLVDQGIMKGNTTLVLQQGFLMIVVALLSMSFGALSSHLGATAGYGIAGNLRKAAYRAIQRFSFNNIDAISVPSLITRLTTDIETIGMVSMMSLRMAFRAPFMMIFALIFSFRINAELAMIFLIILPLGALAIFWIFRTTFPIFDEIRRRVDGVNAVVQEQLTGIKIIKAFVRNRYAEEKFEQRNRANMEAELKAIRVIQVMNPILTAMIYTALIFVLAKGGTRVYEGTMLPGTIIGFTTYVIQIIMSLMMISMFAVNFFFGITSLGRVLEIIDTTSEITPAKRPLTAVPDGSIRFDHVHFRYPGYKDDILNDITLDFKSGQRIGIIGPTGSSKSTLVKMIPRLYDVASGRVLVGGHDVRDYDLDTLRGAIGFVLQKNTLISGTIRSNMLWGRSDASDEEMITALKQAQAWEFVSSFDDGLDHPVEQGGANFSGGQKQRLTIARGLLTHPKILILDDSTSALDMGTDAKLRRVLREELHDITTLIIAQRIDSIRDADQIVVMNDGAVDAVGTHDELLNRSTIYREIFESQQRGLGE